MFLYNSKRMFEHEGLVKSIAFKYRYSGVPIDDLIQYGWLGFLKAKKRYKKGYNTKLSTYAYYYIRAEIQKGIKEFKTIHTPRNNEDKQVISLDIGTWINAFKSDYKQPDELDLEKRLIYFVKEKLSKRDATIVFLRNGYMGRVYTYQEIADLYGFSNQYIQQVYAKAIRKIRGDIK